MISYTRKTVLTDLAIFLGITFILVVIGLLFVYSASSVYALETFGSSSYFIKKQGFGVLLGLAAIIILQYIPFSTIKAHSPFLFFGSLLLTALTLVPALSLRVHGSNRWLHLPGITFQPSELLKITLVLYLAYRITRMASKTSFWYSYVPLLCIVGIAGLVLLKQPDFGLTVTLFATAFIMLLFAEFEIKHIAYTLLSLLPIAAGLIIMYPYRMQRIFTFLNPWDDPRGTGFQIIQSLIAIGSGGISGTGIAHSKQKFFYLPMQHTDFIFSIIAEEIGFIGCVTLITLYALLLYLGIKITRSVSDPFGQLVILGFVFLINLQAIINVCVSTGLLPTKGIGLPLISYGNTALVSNLIMIGIIVSIVRNERNKPVSFYS